MIALSKLLLKAFFENFCQGVLIIKKQPKIETSSFLTQYLQIHKRIIKICGNNFNVTTSLKRTY